MKSHKTNNRLTLLRKVFLLMAGLLMHTPAECQDDRSEVAGIPINYDESKVPEYLLPDPLILASGKKITDAESWYNERRPEILGLFATEQFGKFPDRDKVSFNVFDNGTLAFNQKAIRKQVTIYFTEDTSNYKADLLIYIPVNTSQPSPLFLKIGFSPNCLAVDDPGVREGTVWNREGNKIPAYQARKFSTLDVEKFMDNGIAVATIYYGDIEPDFAEGINYGIRGHYLKATQDQPARDEWGAISAWSWGLSCVMDYLETDALIDSKKVALHGVSRLGKTVLWAGAMDPRFGMIIASCSGEGGAALSRRQYGESIKHMIHPTRFFYQFCGNRATYGDDPNSCPIDAHMLLALVAPRPLLLQTGSLDNWSDPKGEFDAAVAAEPVYELLGKKGLGTDQWPAADMPILHDLGYFMHTGGHGTIPSDYDVYLEFLKMHFFN